MITTRKLGWLAAVPALSLLFCGSVRGATIPLTVAYDAHIDGTNVTANFGTNDVLSIEQTALGGNKAYLLFDASGFGTTNLTRVEGLRVYWGASTGVTRSLAFQLITGTGANEWTEDGITWENAPANNVTGTSRNFVAREGQVVTLIGTMQYQSGNPRELNILFGEGSAEEYALLQALNFGDRKATIGVHYNSSQSTSVGIYSREREGGIYVPTLHVAPEVPTGIPASFILEPVDTTVVTGPYKRVTFSADGAGSPPLTYQWLTNGVAVDGATSKTLVLPADTTNLNGTLVRVRIDNDNTPDPGVLSSNALLTIIEPPVPDGVLQATADVCFAGNSIYNAYTDPASGGQINFGLTAQGGAGITANNRFYVGFTFGTQHVASARLKLYQYWGGPEFNFSGGLAKGEIRVFGATNALTLNEPPPGTFETIDPLTSPYAAPDNTNFIRVSLGADQVIGPDIGWYEWDITEFYNSHPGQPTVFRMSGTQASGFSPLRFEDHENTAYNTGAGGTWANTGPRIEYVLGPPWIRSVAVVGNQLVMTGAAPRNPSATFFLLASPDVGLPVGSWTRVSTNQFGADGNFILSTPMESGATQRFYRLQVP